MQRNRKVILIWLFVSNWTKHLNKSLEIPTSAWKNTLLYRKKEKKTPTFKPLDRYVPLEKNKPGLFPKDTVGLWHIISGKKILYLLLPVFLSQLLNFFILYNLIFVPLFCSCPFKGHGTLIWKPRLLLGLWLPLLCSMNGTDHSSFLKLIPLLLWGF